jgi:hypothetical protein
MIALDILHNSIETLQLMWTLYCLANPEGFTLPHADVSTALDVVLQVFVANEGGYMLSRAGVPEHAIITSLANSPTPDLETFARVLQQQPQGAQVPVQYYTFSDRHRRRNGILHVDKTWCATRQHSCCTIFQAWV